MTTILLMGYQTDFLHDLTEILECEGFKTLVANRVYDGLQLATQHHPNLIVYDVTTTVLNGKVVSNLALIEPTARIPRLFLTNADPRELPDAPYLLKPFTMSALFRKLEQILSQIHGTAIYQSA